MLRPMSYSRFPDLVTIKTSSSYSLSLCARPKSDKSSRGFNMFNVLDTGTFRKNVSLVQKSRRTSTVPVQLKYCTINSLCKFGGTELLRSHDSRQN
jgi:hypothetical protein